MTEKTNDTGFMALSTRARNVLLRITNAKAGHLVTASDLEPVWDNRYWRMLCNAKHCGVRTANEICQWLEGQGVVISDRPAMIPTTTTSLRDQLATARARIAELEAQKTVQKARLEIFQEQIGQFEDQLVEVRTAYRKECEAFEREYAGRLKAEAGILQLEAENQRLGNRLRER